MRLATAFRCGREPCQGYYTTRTADAWRKSRGHRATSSTRTSQRSSSPTPTASVGEFGRRRRGVGLISAHRWLTVVLPHPPAALPHRPPYSIEHSPAPAVIGGGGTRSGVLSGGSGEPRGLVLHTLASRRRVYAASSRAAAVGGARCIGVISSLAGGLDVGGDLSWWVMPPPLGRGGPSRWVPFPAASRQPPLIVPSRIPWGRAALAATDRPAATRCEWFDPGRPARSPGPARLKRGGPPAPFRGDGVASRCGRRRWRSGIGD